MSDPTDPGNCEYAAGQRLLAHLCQSLGARLIDYVVIDGELATTATCPGHAMLATGAYGNLNGIIGKSWYVPSQGKEVSCVADSNVHLVGAATGTGMSPHNLTTRQYCDAACHALPDPPGVGGKVLHPAVTNPGEPCPGRRFSEPLPSTPFANQLELNFATVAIRNEKLGYGPATDQLAILLSANDYIGHGYGPYSPEAADAMLRIDRYLADFFRKVDQLVGLNNVWITLSADHGVAPIPAFIPKHHLGPDRLDAKAVKEAVEQALVKAFGPGDWLAVAGEFYLNLNRPALESHHISITLAQSVAARAALSVPTIRAAFTRTQSLTGLLPHTPLAHKVANSYNPTRSGDAFLIPQHLAVVTNRMAGNSHGTPWNYDTHASLVFWVQKFKPGTYTGPAQPIDLASTLAAALGLTQPSDAQGRPLTSIPK